MTQFKVGQLVEFKTSWPFATRQALIVNVLSPIGNYVAVPISPYSESWKEAPLGEQMWIPDGRVIS